MPTLPPPPLGTLPPSAPRILWIEDDPGRSFGLVSRLRARGVTVDVVGADHRVVGHLARTRYELVVLDLPEPTVAGWRALDLVPRGASGVATMVVGASLPTDLLARVGRLGLSDAVPHDARPGQVVDRVEAAFLSTPQQVYLDRLERPAGLVAESEVMQRVLGRLERLARTAAPVLFVGEPGTGKSTLAAELHGAHAAGPLVRGHLAAIPPGLIDAHLYGFVGDAYTGAARDRRGLFGAPGAVLLHGVAFLDLAAQPELGRVLDEGRYRPRGADAPRPVEARVLSTIRQDPRDAIAAARLAPELLPRLGKASLRLPPLRRRPEDLLPLAERFLADLSGVHERRGRLAPSAREALRAHDWPGNLTELRNALERALVLGPEGPVEAEALGLPAPGRPRSSVRPPSIAPEERAAIEQALAATDGSAEKAAARLGISRTTLWNKMRRYDLGR